VLLAANFLILDIRPFWLATLLLVANNVALIACWDRTPKGSAPSAGRRFQPSLVAAIAVTLIVIAARAWLQQILVYPIDAQRADMLVVIQLGIRRLLQGHDPYTMYHVPWSATLPYGPVMWAPMIGPYLFNADLRFATLAGALFIPIAAGWSAIVLARRGDVLSSAGVLILVAAIAFSPDIRAFVSIGHTPAYWPLVALFAWLVHRERWTAAAIACGLLIVARSTMIALAPVLSIAIWQRDRATFARAAVALTAAVVVTLLPFAIVDFRALTYALYGSYQTVIKGFVWTQTDWVQRTIGVTGPLLTRGWTRAVEPVQIGAMALTGAAGWVALKRGHRPLPWLGFSLVVFSITTIWPVIYVYFDPFLLLVSATLAETLDAPRVWPRWTMTAIAASIVVLAMTIAEVPAHASIDVGSDEARPLLYNGFAGDERVADRSYAWVTGTRAKMLVPSRSRASAAIEITCEPYLPDAHARQEVTATLNGVVLGSIPLKDGWQTISLAAPARAWQIGVNELDLFMASANSPRDAGESNDPRQLSVAIDRLNVIRR